jgi:carbon-monoxide dehydrogenase large subunit
VTSPDRPNRYIGASVRRPNARRLVAGRGTYVDDLTLPRMIHLAFIRSPHAHAKITNIDLGEASRIAGVTGIFTGADLAPHCGPWEGVLSHLEGLRSAPQYALAVDRVCFQGEPVVAVAARSRAIAEDAAYTVAIDYEELPVVADLDQALAPQTPVIHPDLGSNLAWQREVIGGDPAAGFAAADKIVEDEFRFSRHTGVTLEPRGIIAEFEPADGRMTIHHSGQAPHNMQAIFATLVDLPEANVRVISRDVGGSFGIKGHTYSDEVATVAIAKILGRPVKYIADRLEAFLTDIHAREHRIRARMGVTDDGKITAFEIEDLMGSGPYSIYPRTSVIEAFQIISLSGAQYAIENYKAVAQVAYQNKGMMSQYRAVGHPVATAVGEAMAEKAADAVDLDPVEFRRRNLVADDAYPTKAPSGVPIEKLSHQACLDKIVDMIGYDALRADQARARQDGIYRGIGLASFVELTNPSPVFYGSGGARISAQDGCTIRLEPPGVISCAIGVTEQGQGTETIIAQVAATAMGVPFENIRVLTGDTDNSPYGGGVWGSRGAGIGGEATLQAAKALRANVLEVAGTILQAEPDTLDIVDGIIVDGQDGTARVSLADLAAQVQFRTSEIPNEIQPEFVATRHFRVTGYPFVLTNGIQATYMEVDIETGQVKFLGYWVVEDCGTILNPLLVDEQIRGGVAQGIGGALSEECKYDIDGQFQGGTMADYLVPMAFEMPDIEVGHVTTPTATSELGAKGAGEAGTGGAPAAIMNAINDALKPIGARVTTQPITPERILSAIGKV